MTKASIIAAILTWGVIAFGSDQRQVLVTAKTLQDEKRWNDATDLLRQGRAMCDSEKQPEACRAELDFGLAYAYQRWAAELPGENSTRHLTAAIEAYDRVLQQYPRNIDVLKNKALAERARGNSEAAIPLFHTLVELDRDNAATYLIAIGDIQRWAERFDDSQRSYRRAADLDPQNEAAWQLLLSTYLRAPTKVPELLALARELRQRDQLALAAKALEAIVASRTSPEAEEALVEWVDLQTQRDAIFAGTDALPGFKDWDTAAVRELLQVVADPVRGAQSLSWWRLDRPRRHAIANAMMDLAHGALAKKAPERAAAILEAAITITPSVFDYNASDLRGKPNLYMDMNLELARLYQLYPALDPDQNKFRRMERELFDEKLIASIQQDRESKQRLHTILGLIYADRGIWSSAEYYTNAMFQLEQAIALATRRAAEGEDRASPVPHLQTLVAGQYLRQGRESDARRLFGNAAHGYFDLDDVRSAAGALEKSTPNRFLADLLSSRLQVENLARDQMEVSSAGHYSRSPAFQWLERTPPNVDAGFLERQRFKVISDLARRAETLGLRDEASKLYLRAFDRAKAAKRLTSPLDLARLDAISRSILRAVDVTTVRPSATGSGLEQTEEFRRGKIWTLPLSGTDATVQVGWSVDLMLAAAAADLARSSPWGSRALLEVRDQTITLYVAAETLDSPQSKSAVASLRNLAGVREVKLQPQ